MGTISAGGLEAALDTSTPVQLVRAAAALRWKRPDLTVTLAELALDAADDPATWVAAAGWLLHGRNVLGDGRQIACDLLDGLERWGDAGAELMAGPRGRRLRVELAGPARRTGEQAVARALLTAEPGVDALDAELRADVLAELARCAADETPETAGAALDAAEEAWLALGCEPGIASVLLARAARDRRAGRADDAVAAALSGLGRVNASGRRSGGTDSDHLAAALTAEWIAALVDAGRLDEARDVAVPAASRLLVATRPSRQLAGLRLAVARVAAAADDTETVLAALEPAAQDAADADVPELESACRSMLGELHEAAGRLDAALAAVRGAMTAERCDHDRGARLRVRLTAATATWTARPAGPATPRYPVPGVLTDAERHPALDDAEAGRGDRAAEVVGDSAPVGEPDRIGGPSDPSSTSSNRTARAATWSGATRAGRRARRLAAEAADAAESAGPGWPGASLPELGTPAPDPEPADPKPANLADGDGTPVARAATEPPTGAPARTTDTGRAVAVGAAPGSASLIGDALLRELIDNAGGPGASAGDRHPPANGHDSADALVDSRTDRRGHEEHGHRVPANVPNLGRFAAGSPAPQARGADAGVDDTVVFELDPRHDSTVTVPPVLPTGDPDAAARGQRPGRDVEPAASSPPRADGRPSTAAGGRRAAVGADTVRVGRPVEPGQPTGRAGAPPAPNGDRGAAEREHPGGAPDPAGAPRPGDARRRCAPDTDGLGIGDLLAGALAAYRGI